MDMMRYTLDPMANEITTEVRLPRQYRMKLKAAKKLGNLWVKSHYAGGRWETQDGQPVFFRGDIDIEGHGIKYFEVPVDGDVEKVHPVRVDDDRSGYLEITFIDQNTHGATKIDHYLRHL